MVAEGGECPINASGTTIGSDSLVSALRTSTSPQVLILYSYSASLFLLVPSVPSAWLTSLTPFPRHNGGFFGHSLCGSRHFWLFWCGGGMALDSFGPYTAILHLHIYQRFSSPSISLKRAWLDWVKMAVRILNWGFSKINKHAFFFFSFFFFFFSSRIVPYFLWCRRVVPVFLTPHLQPLSINALLWKTERFPRPKTSLRYVVPKWVGPCQGSETAFVTLCSSITPKPPSHHHRWSPRCKVSWHPSRPMLLDSLAFLSMRLLNWLSMLRCWVVIILGNACLCWGFV